MDHYTKDFVTSFAKTHESILEEEVRGMTPEEREGYLDDVARQYYEPTSRLRLRDSSIEELGESYISEHAVNLF